MSKYEKKNEQLTCTIRKVKLLVLRKKEKYSSDHNKVVISISLSLHRRRHHLSVI